MDHRGGQTIPPPQDEEWVLTSTLPEGALFVSPDGILYQVVMAKGGGFRKAEPWPWLPYGWSIDAERPNAVALVPDSPLARNYPVVARGKPLPNVSLEELSPPGGRPIHYIFPTEQLARLAAQLDETLAHTPNLKAYRTAGRWVLALSGKEVMLLRVYHYLEDSAGTPMDLEARFAGERIEALPCTQGPSYWRYIPGWRDKVTGEIQESEVSVSPPLVEERVSPAVIERRESMSAMILAVDIGYGYTKGIAPNGLRFSFPSVVGAAEEINFSTDLIRGGEERPVRYDNWRFFYGQQAVLQSRIQSAIFDRSRVQDHTFKLLFVAALVELAKHMPEVRHLNVVTGLPVDFFADRSEVIRSFEGTYRITADRAIELTVDAVFVAPQPFGSLFRELLNENGKIVNTEIERGRIGVIDIGSYTTDFIVSDELRYVQRLSGSARVGWSKVVAQVQQALDDRYMLELMPHEVDRAIQLGEVRVRGEPVPIGPLVEPAINDIRTAIVARARDLWGTAASLDVILVTGGGGPRLYDAIRETYPHARLLENAFWANAEGFMRFAQRPATFQRQ
ncbi:MAG: ParM/StbA family protein [Anaerolineae bacterium]|nr:ParM/StbA family protein [Anaerolineae bacterium]